MYSFSQYLTQDQYVCLCVCIYYRWGLLSGYFCHFFYTNYIHASLCKISNFGFFKGCLEFKDRSKAISVQNCSSFNFSLIIFLFNIFKLISFVKFFLKHLTQSQKNKFLFELFNRFECFFKSSNHKNIYIPYTNNFGRKKIKAIS